jgi:carbon storage regulator CsrA
MLVLTRKNLEAVVVGGANGFEPLLKITIVEIAHGKVRLGFEARDDVPIHRLEVWERIRACAPIDPTPENGLPQGAVESMTDKTRCQDNGAQG